MILATHGIIASQIASFDADAVAFFNRVTTAGGTLSLTEKNATNQLVLDMKSAGIWSAMKAIYPMVGASAAACAQNLKSSSFTGTFSSGWTFASTGATPNGTSAFFDTNLNQSGNLTPSNNHISVYSRTNFNGSSGFSPMDCGITNNISYSFQIISPRSNDLALYENGTHSISVSNTNSQGLFIGTSTSSTSAKFYKNGSSIGTSTATQTRTMFSNNVYFGASNISTTNTAVYFSARENAFASIGDGLTDTQSLNLYTAVQIFNTTLNRSVGTPTVSDADAQAYIDRVYTAGGTLTNTEANAVNQLTIDMKAAGIWTAMKAVYPMVGSSAAACAQNLKSSSFTGSFSSGWTFASTGVTGNGSSTYMDTALQPSTQLSLNNGHLSYYSRTNNTFDASEIGASQGGGQQTQIIINFSGSSFDSVNNSPAGTTRSWTSNAMFLVSRTASNLYKSFRNNSIIATYTTASNTLPTTTIYLGARSGPSLIPTNRECAFASIGDGLDDTQAASLYTCVQTFNTTLSRQV